MLMVKLFSGFLVVLAVMEELGIMFMKTSGPHCGPQGAFETCESIRASSSGLDTVGIPFVTFISWYFFVQNKMVHRKPVGGGRISIDDPSRSWTASNMDNTAGACVSGSDFRISKGAVEEFHLVCE